ncbi:MAG: PAS domain S-box protein [Terriglobales bacterium]
MWFAWMASAITASVGIAAILGWILDSVVLVSYVGGSFPLQFNTAVCLVFSGLSTAALLRERRTLAVGLALIDTGIAALCVVEIFVAPGLGVVRMFYDAPPGGLETAPLAPNSGIALLLAGASTVLLASGRARKIFDAAAAILASGIAAFAAISLVGYALQLSSAYRWGENTPMSVPAGIGLLACGLAILAADWNLDPDRHTGSPSWAPLAILSMLATASILLFSSLQLDASLTQSWSPGERRSLDINTVATLVLGFATSIALTVAMVLSRKNNDRSRQLQATNLALGSEIAQRRAAQRTTEQLNKALRIVSACRQAIVQSENEDELLGRICEAGVESGGYSLVWIGFADRDEGKTVRARAKRGIATDYLQENLFTWADDARGRGPTGTAIRTGRPALCRDTLAEESFSPWRDRALQFGFRSTLVVPLLRQGSAFGSVSIYSPEIDGFGEQEVALFSQLADDLAFGIEALRARAERLQAESALQASEERYRCLADATAQIVWITDPNGLVRDDMPSWRAFTGMTYEQIQGWGWLDSLHPDDRASTAEVWEQAVAARSLYETEYRIRRADGAYRHVWVRGVPVLEDGGEVREWVGTCTDITERKLTEARLREQAALLDLAPAGIFVRDLESRVAFWSRGAEELYGWTAEEAAGQVSHELLRTEFPLTPAALAEVVIRDAFWQGELRHTCRDGRRIDVASRWALRRNDRGEPTGFLEINLDISERRLAQQALERSNNELQDFAFVASHDLQEPLRKITAFSERLRDRCAEQLDETGLDFLHRMHNAAGRMARLIDSLLEYSRLGTRALPFEDVDLATTFAGVVADLEQRIRESGARLIVRPLPRLNGDPVQLRQLLQNLVANALKFHAPGARPQVIVDSLQRDGHWEISVRDNGIGLDPAYADRIFRPFQRLHGRNEYEGSGMGLAICRKISQRHGATIDVASQPGQGATFTIVFPKRDSESATRDQRANSETIPSPDCERMDTCQTQYESSSPKMTTTISC